MSISSISLLETAVSPSAKILQLYPHLELYCVGEPPHNTLFVMERALLSMGSDGAGDNDRLLLIDPPVDASTKFRLPDQVAVIFTGEFTGKAQITPLPLLQTIPGGVAHLRIGEHFLDIYSQRNGSIIYFPALGLLCGGMFGNETFLPKLSEGSDGSEELETLRLLVQLVKRRLQLYIPQVGEVVGDSATIIARLADDVGYLHGLRWVLPALIERGEPLDAILRIGESLLPSNRRTDAAREQHLFNLMLLHTQLANL